MDFKINYLFKASKEVLSDKKYLLLALILTVLAFFVFVSIQVFLIPGNSFNFQLSIYTTRDYLLLVLLSFLIALILTMNIWILKRTRKPEIGKSTVGGISVIMASVFGTAACSSCLAGVFGLLGLSFFATIGLISTFLSYQWIIVGIATLFALISLYFSSKKIVKECKDCEV